MTQLCKKNAVVQTVAPETLFDVRKEIPDRGSNNFRRRLIICVYVNKQASMLAATSHAAEVSKLKQILERANEELGRVKTAREQARYAMAYADLK